MDADSISANGVGGGSGGNPKKKRKHGQPAPIAPVALHQQQETAPTPSGLTLMHGVRHCARLQYPHQRAACVSAAFDMLYHSNVARGPPLELPGLVLILAIAILQTGPNWRIAVALLYQCAQTLKCSNAQTIECSKCSNAQTDSCVTSFKLVSLDPCLCCALVCHRLCMPRDTLFRQTNYRRRCGSTSRSRFSRRKQPQTPTRLLSPKLDGTSKEASKLSMTKASTVFNHSPSRFPVRQSKLP